MEYEIKQKGRWVFIRPFPEPELLFRLEKEFTYIKNGAKFMPNPKWAEVKLYNRKFGKLPIGLLHRLEFILKDMGYTASNEAHRATLMHENAKDDDLYSFQKSALRMVLFRRGGILQMPTGAGKTRTALAVIKTLELPTLVIVPTLDLKDQWERQIPENTIVKTYQSLKTKSFVQQFGLVVFDECHNVAAKTLQKIGMNLRDDAITLGLSATPMMRDDDNLKVESVLGPIIYRISLRELINEGYLVDALVHYHHLDFYDNPFNTYPMMYEEYIEKNEQRNDKIIQLAQEANGYTLILVSRICHGEYLEHQLVDHDCVFLNGGTKNRDGKMDHKIIIATSIFDEGIDIPHLETLILAGGGKSAIKTTQRIGRVLRKFPGKKMAMVHDFADNARWLSKHYKTRRKIYEEDFEVVDVE
jgi:superfamily II DNA or RNA helicase